MIKKAYFYMQVLSIDVVLGACVSNLFIAQLLEIDLGWLDVLSLAFAVWIIYTFDHLLDARAIPHSAHTDRHAFHQRHFYFLRNCLFSLLFVEAIIVCFLPKELIINGFVLAGIVGCYFLMLQSMKFLIPYLKEISIASIYVLGIFLAPFTYSDQLSESSYSIYFILFLGMATVNLLLFSYMDAESDSKDHQISIVDLLGKFKIQKLIGFLLSILLFVTLFVIGILQYKLKEHLLLLLMQLILWSVYFFKEYQGKVNVLRALADAVFMLPLLSVLNP